MNTLEFTKGLLFFEKHKIVDRLLARLIGQIEGAPHEHNLLVLLRSLGTLVVIIISHWAIYKYTYDRLRHQAAV